MKGPPPLAITPLRPVSCGSLLWRSGGSLRATVFIKATFGLVHEGSAKLIAPLPIVYADHPRSDTLAASLDAASEAAPHIPNAGVVLHGHAHAPPGQRVPAMAVRLALFRARPLLDKTLYIYGDRAAASQGAPEPFQSMPITYERAYGGPGLDTNPTGVGAQTASRTLPNIIDPALPRRPAGLGPIPAQWHARRRLLGGADPSALEQAIPELPAELDMAYFNAAPEDQRIDYLHGDEWIVLDGLHPSLPRVQTHLPNARGQARWYLTDGDPRGLQEIALVADTLVIDADKGICSVVWRGHFELADAAMADRVHVLAGVELPGYPIEWPSPVEPLVAAPASTAARPPLEFTLPDEPSERKEAMPFSTAAPSARATEDAAKLPGLPWTGVPAAPPIKMSAIDQTLAIEPTSTADDPPEVETPARPPSTWLGEPTSPGDVNIQHLLDAIPFKQPDPQADTAASSARTPSGTPARARPPADQSMTVDMDIGQVFGAAIPFAVDAAPSERAPSTAASEPKEPSQPPLLPYTLREAPSVGDLPAGAVYFAPAPPPPDLLSNASPPPALFSADPASKDLFAALPVAAPQDPSTEPAPASEPPREAAPAPARPDGPWAPQTPAAEPAPAPPRRPAPAPPVVNGLYSKFSKKKP